LLVQPSDTCRIAKKPEPPKPIIWSIYKIASKAVWQGNVATPDQATAMEKVPNSRCRANRLVAIRR
jgi:hypothetical protein